jgi:hypothetical protein
VAREGVGAAVGPLAGVRVPHEGERAAVERFRDGALCPVPHSGGQVSTRLTLSVQPVHVTTVPAAVLKTAGEVLYSLSMFMSFF